MNKSETSLRAYKPHPNYVNPNITNTVGRQFRVYVKPPLTWKGKKGRSDSSNNVINASAPTNSRPPLTAGGAGGSYDGGRGGGVSVWRGNKATFAPNPIRHWRKQLQPTQGATSRQVGVGQIMDRPGGSVITSKSPQDNSCDTSSCSVFLPTYIPHNYVKPLDVSNCQRFKTYQPYGREHKEKMVICDPEYRARKASRYASTNLSKKYYTTGKAYLRARVKLHDQNQTLSQKSGTTYSTEKYQPISANNYVTPTDLSNGSQEYNSTNCNQLCMSTEESQETCQKSCVIYKPSNYLFSRNGAVSSSSRIARLKYNTIKNNNWQLDINLKPPPLVGSTPQLYRGNVNAPYFIKSKYQLPNSCAAGSLTNRKHSIPGLYPGSRMPSGGSGIKTVCFPQTSDNDYVCPTVAGTGGVVVCQVGVLTFVPPPSPPPSPLPPELTIYGYSLGGPDPPGGLPNTPFGKINPQTITINTISSAVHSIILITHSTGVFIALGTDEDIFDVGGIYEITITTNSEPSGISQTIIPDNEHDVQITAESGDMYNILTTIMAEKMPFRVNIFRIGSLLPTDTLDQLQVAVNLWILDKSQAISTYGQINTWDTSLVTSMRALFEPGGLTFNDDISNWDTNAVTDMSSMFSGAIAFNQDLSSWDTGAVQNMSEMFKTAESFDKDLSSWHTGAVQNMSGMFNGAIAFNQELTSWNTGAVTDMSEMFKGATDFNSEVDFDTNSVTNMSEMFMNATAFHSVLSFTDVSAADNMSNMFDAALLFNQTLSSWVLNPGVDMSEMFVDATQMLLTFTVLPDTPVVGDWATYFPIIPWGPQTVNDGTVTIPIIPSRSVNFTCGHIDIDSGGESTLTFEYSDTTSDIFKVYGNSSLHVHNLTTSRWTEFSSVGDHSSTIIAAAGGTSVITHNYTISCRPGPNTWEWINLDSSLTKITITDDADWEGWVDSTIVEA